MIYLIISLFAFLIFGFLEIGQALKEKDKTEFSIYPLLRLFLLTLFVISFSVVGKQLEELKPKAEGVCPEYKQVDKILYERR